MGGVAALPTPEGYLPPLCPSLWGAGPGHAADQKGVCVAVCCSCVVAVVVASAAISVAVYALYILVCAQNPHLEQHGGGEYLGVGCDQIGRL